MSRSNWPVEYDAIFGCWNWTGYKDKRDGRALVWRGKSPVQAYRVVYEAEVGPIPDGLVLGHECANASCVAPHHLRPITKSDNEKLKHWRRVVRITHCKNGHNMQLHCVKTPWGAGRVCRQCNRDAAAAERGKASP